MLNKPFILIAEKPDAAKAIAKIFPHKIKNGFIEVDENNITGSSGIITYAFGHLVELADPEYIDEKYKTWSWDTLPITPDNIPLRPANGKEQQLRLIKQLANRTDIKVIINACDAGRGANRS
ncbi:DNA topoisomerase III [Bacillus cereus]|uniref:DNA topoisomerase III n=1 Tax=Bacillus cereus TaxID=1396 RepID=A0A9X7CPK5_BACCE|nr:toprim domain-containing protein [Bacillus cereus]PGS80281.1 DNA topoisomerase III [Bacillus cereus]